MPAFFLFPRMMRKFPAPVLPERPSRTTDTTRASRLDRNQSVTYPGANRPGRSSTQPLRMRTPARGRRRGPRPCRAPHLLPGRDAQIPPLESLAASQWGPPPQGLTAARPGNPSLRFPPGPKATGGARAAMPSAVCRVRSRSPREPRAAPAPGRPRHPRAPLRPQSGQAGEAGRRDKAPGLAPRRYLARAVAPGARPGRAARGAAGPGRALLLPGVPGPADPWGPHGGGAHRRPAPPRRAHAARTRAHAAAAAPSSHARPLAASPTPPRGPGTAGSRHPAGAPRPAQQPPAPCSGAGERGRGPTAEARAAPTAEAARPRAPQRPAPGTRRKEGGGAAAGR